MFTWILIIGAVLLLAGLAWTSSGPARKGAVDSEAVRNAKRDNNAKGDYFGGI
ncbi:hypothetical protein [Nocardioides albus]|uniref:Uncharacterized protein n=1 Tax=Nocardioides albus TaxID=1841 RepID=A0A7W5FB33_9ACTN|nr:hypothetical protein [Nocardioides albus]MBB3091797.1 hypothetical protein [Nocardioides albus]GGU31801.1 hypothetical protein GCM10007979_33540 [Nocardioides albus]